MLVLVRHGESTANAEGRLLGRSDVELTGHGRAQARAVGRALAASGKVTAVRSSPLRRAVDTAELLGTSLPVEVPVAVDERWVELDYGEHDGKPLTDVPHEVWRRWREDPSFRPRGGESLAEMTARVENACEELFATAGAGARAEGGDVVVVSHVSPIKAAVGWALGAGPEVAFRLHLSTGSITRLGWSPTGPVLHCFNEVPACSE